MNEALLSFLTDEVSDRLDEALDFARAERLTHLELRTVGGKNLLRMDDGEIDAIRRAVDAASLTVLGFASPVLKWPCREGGKGVEALRAHGYTLDPGDNPDRVTRRAFEICRRLGTDRLRVFTFLREPRPTTEELAGAFRRLVALAREFRVRLLVEHESVCHVGRWSEVDAFLREFREPEVELLLDPGNFLEAGDAPRGVPVPWAARVGHMHVKDYDPATRTFHPLGQGKVDFSAVLSSLKGKGPATIGLSLETHCPTNKREASSKSLAALRQLLAHLSLPHR